MSNNFKSILEAHSEKIEKNLFFFKLVREGKIKEKLENGNFFIETFPVLQAQSDLMLLCKMNSSTYIKI